MNYELTYSLQNKYFATFSYSKTSDNITDVLKPTVENGNIVVVQTNDNLSSASYLGLYLIAPVKVTKWWDMNNSANFYYGSYTGSIADTYIKNREILHSMSTASILLSLETALQPSLQEITEQERSMLIWI